MTYGKVVSYAQKRLTATVISVSVYVLYRVVHWAPVVRQNNYKQTLHGNEWGAQSLVPVGGNEYAP